jgi:type IX secretion system PorP/SprF family membrane protein
MKHYFVKGISLFILQFSFYLSASSQDPQFTQSFGAMTYNNPSFTGSDTMGTVFITHRNQWPKLSGTYQTTFFGWQQYIGTLNSYAGFHYMYDKAGALTTQRITLNYAQNIKIKKLLLRPSFEAAFFQKTIDWDQLSFGDQIDPRTGFAFTTGDRARCGSISNVDFNFGLLANYSNFSLGISIHHLTQPNESLTCGNSPLPMKSAYHKEY